MNVFLVDFENVKSSGLNGINRLDESDRVVIFYSENADSMTFDLHEQINKSKADITFQKVTVGIKNALDFQLATYLGYLICQNEKEEQAVRYYLVTKDHGYSSLETYWTQRRYRVTLIGSLASGKIIPNGQETADSPSQGASARLTDIQPEEFLIADPAVVAEAEPEKSADEGGKKKKKKKEADSKSGKKSGKKKEESPEVKELRIRVEQAVPDKSVVDLVVNYIQKYKTKLGINNALAKEFKDSKKASEIYKSIKPLIADKKGQ